MIGAAPPDHAFGLTDAVGAVIRWTMFGGTLAAVGAVTFVDGILRSRGITLSAATRDTILLRVRRLVATTGVILIACAAVRLVLQVTQLADGDPMMPVARAVLAHTQWGIGWIVGLAGAVGLLLSARSFGRWRRDGLSALRWGSVVALATSPALTGHAAATPGFARFPFFADVAHVLAGGAWLGTLTVMAATILRRSTANRSNDIGPHVAEIIRAFSPVALASAAVVTLSGVVSGWLHVGTIGHLFDTDYGLWLTRKIVLFLCIVAAGAYNWRRATPKLAHADDASPLIRSAALELTLTAILLAITAMLVVTSPSIDR